MAIHAKLVGVDTRRLLVVGDVHGCPKEVEDLLDACNYRKQEDVVLFLGDLVAKGPDPVGAVRLARKLGAHTVRGNHEVNVIRTHRAWMERGKKLKSSLKYLQRFSEEDWSYLKHAPHTLRVPSHNVMLVHGGVLPGVHLRKQKPKDLCRMRDVVIDEEGILHARERSVHGSKPWASLWKGPEHVLFGHDAVRGLQQHPFATGLDTGCCYGGELTACIVPPLEVQDGPFRIQSVPARRVYCKP
mmetsp:Transcript_7950/g.28264  ORF Transcript_7950/g.28264 Transcript_7950/m.28264 type:complete len:243 (+) Transcript_7950:423-1151(+)